MKIILCRHGETEWSLSGKHTGRTDLSLTERGRLQSQQLGERLRSFPITTVVSSPMKRALQTCEFARVSAQPFIDADAREWDYGAYEGLTSQEIHQLDSSWTIFSKGAPQGESIEQITQRADRLLHKLLLYRGIVLLISHGHFSRVLAARWLNLEAGMGRCFMLSVASLSILGYEREDRAIQLWNDTSFLGSS